MINGNNNSGARLPVVVSQRMTDHTSRFSRAPRIFSVRFPVVVSQRMTDHTSRFNLQENQCNPNYKNTVPKRYPDD